MSTPSSLFAAEVVKTVLCRPGPSTYARPDCKAKPCKFGFIKGMNRVMGSARVIGVFLKNFKRDSTCFNLKS